jgi:hypothetical protein
VSHLRAADRTGYAFVLRLRPRWDFLTRYFLLAPIRQATKKALGRRKRPRALGLERVRSLANSSDRRQPAIFGQKKPSVLYRGLEVDRSHFLLIADRGTWRGQAPYHRGGWRPGPARFSSYRKPRGGWGVSVSTVRVGCDAFGLGRCDGRHKSNFRYPIIFWTAA